MDLVDRKQGKERISELVEYFDGFCLAKNETKSDVLAFEYRRELKKAGKYKEAKTFEKYHRNPSLVIVQPLSPRKTASHSVMFGMS